MNDNGMNDKENVQKIWDDIQKSNYDVYMFRMFFQLDKWML